MRRLLRHSLGFAVDPEAAVRTLDAGGGDLFWLDSGRHGVHVLGTGARILPGRGAVLDTLRETNVLDDDTIAELDKAVDAFKLEFQTGEGKPLVTAGNEQFEELEEEEIEQEKIVKGRR